MRRILHLILLAGVLLASCQTTPPPAQQADLTGAADSAATADAAKLKQLLNTLPAPRQAMDLLLASGARFAAELPNTPAAASRYQTTVKAGLNLGVYSADLAYAGAFRQNQLALQYFNAVQDLGDRLGLSGAFDPTVLERLDRNRDNADSTSAILTKAFEKADRSLRANNQGDVARLLVLGGWVEGLYLSCELHARRPNAELGQRIAEQKVLLEEVLRLVNETPMPDDFKPYLEGLNAVNAAYQPVQIEYRTGQAQVNPKTQEVRIENHNRVVFTDSDLASIRKAVAELRSRIIA